MAIQGSPDVFMAETDLTLYTQANSTTRGGVVGDFAWGPVDEATTIADEASLVRDFGKPNDQNYKDWFTARNFLNYSGNLRLIRVCSDDAKNACDAPDECVLIKNQSSFEKLVGTLSEKGKEAKVFGRYPGDFGNGLRVVIAGVDTLQPYPSTPETLEDGDEEEPGTPITPEIPVMRVPNTKHILAPYVTKNMEDTDIAFGVFKNGELVEFKMCSLTKGSVDMNGYKNYLIAAVNNTSSYVFLIESNVIVLNEDGSLPTDIDIDVTLSGGSSPALTTGNYKAGWAMFANSDVEEVSLLMQGGGNVEIGQTVSNLASTRKDCVACVSPMEEQVVEVLNPEVLMQQNLTSYGATSYRFYDGNYKYQYDAYNDKYRWVPLNGDIAGVMAQTDIESFPWFSPGGKTIKDVVKLAFYPTKAQRDTMYAATINPVTAFKEEGTVLWGDWTGVTNTKFNFIGVRRLFIHMERNLGAMARKAMWQQNDEVTEVSFTQAAEPFLRNIQGQRGISDFKVYAGQVVTSSDEMDQGLFKAKVAVKPITSIRWVEINFVATRSDVEFDEVIV